MRMVRTACLIGALLVVCALQAGSAHAAGVFEYSVYLEDGINMSVPGGNFGVTKLDGTKTTRIEVKTPGNADRMLPATQAAGPTYFNSPDVDALSTGDTIKIYQPSGAVTATDTYVIPDVTLNLTVGATALTGNMPAGMVGSVQGDWRCDRFPNAYSVGAGAYSVPNSPVIPGEIASIAAVSPIGDSVYVNRHAPGETPCIEIRADNSSFPLPGGPANPKPFNIAVDHLLASVAPSVRVVLKRGGSVLFDQSGMGQALSQSTSVQGLPGDVVEVYRPMGAAAPAHTLTVPAISGKFDAAVDLVAVDSPPAGAISTRACRALSCPKPSERTLLNVPAGRTLIDYGRPQQSGPVIDLRPDDRITAEYANTEYTFDYSFSVPAGDLVAPKVSRLPAKVRLSALVKALSKGYKFKLTSSEAASSSIALTLPTAAKAAAKKAKAVKLASAKPALKAGSNTVRLKFTSGGKKTIKRLAKLGRRAGTRTAILTTTVTDASGNAATTARTLKIKP